MNDNVEQRGEPAEASGLPFGTPNPANVTDADTRDAKAAPPAPGKAPQRDRKSITDESPGVDSPAQGTDGTQPPSYTGETGDAGPHPEEQTRRTAYERAAD